MGVLWLVFGADGYISLWKPHWLPPTLICKNFHCLRGIASNLLGSARHSFRQNLWSKTTFRSGMWILKGETGRFWMQLFYERNSRNINGYLNKISSVRNRKNMHGICAFCLLLGEIYTVVDNNWMEESTLLLRFWAEAQVVLFRYLLALRERHFCYFFNTKLKILFSKCMQICISMHFILFSWDT